MIEEIFIFVFGDIHPDILTHRKNNGEKEFWESGPIFVDLLKGNH